MSTFQYNFQNTIQFHHFTSISQFQQYVVISELFHHFISFHFISFHFISFHFISFHFISFHFISFHFTISLHHFISPFHFAISFSFFVFLICWFIFLFPVFSIFFLFSFRNFRFPPIFAQRFGFLTQEVWVSPPPPERFGVLPSTLRRFFCFPPSSPSLQEVVGSSPALLLTPGGFGVPSQEGGFRIFPALPLGGFGFLPLSLSLSPRSVCKFFPTRFWVFFFKEVLGFSLGRFLFFSRRLGFFPLLAKEVLFLFSPGGFGFFSLLGGLLAVFLPGSSIWAFSHQEIFGVFPPEGVCGFHQTVVCGFWVVFFSSVFQYFTRSRFVTYLLRSTLGTTGITITRATPWSAFATGTTGLASFRWSGLSCHETPRHVALNTRSHLSCSSILAILVRRFTPSGMRKIAALHLSWWRTWTPRSIFWSPPRIALFSPCRLKRTDWPNSATGHFQLFPHRRWSGVRPSSISLYLDTQFAACRGIHDVSGSFSSIRLPSPCSSWLLKILACALISRTQTSGRPFAAWSLSGDVISTNSTPGKLFETRSVKLNSDRSLSDLTRILLNPNLALNAFMYEVASSDAPFLSTAVAFDAMQWRHQLLYNACSVNSCSAICLRRETWHQRNHELFTIHRIISHWIIVCSSYSSWVCTIR